MHFSMSSPSTDSDFSTPSEDFEQFSVSPELQDAWSVHVLEMADQIFSDQYGRLSAPSQEWTPSSAVRDCTITEPHIHQGDDSGTLYSQNHQVSSFNLPLIYDSTLTTPVSLHPESPNPHGKTLNDAQWNRGQQLPLQYPMRGIDGAYINSSSTSMKSKSEALTMSSSDADGMLAISPFIFDSPSTPCPPTPYWGSFGVSAPSTSTAPTSAGTTESAKPISNAPPSSGSNQAPILVAPSPHRRPRQRISDGSIVQDQSQHGLQIQMNPNFQQSQIQPAQTRIKRECPSPGSRPKRQRRSAPSPEQQKPLSKDDLSEEDKILLHLRDIKGEEKWDWKELTERFNRETGGKHNLAALQMRHTRLMGRMRVWTDIEIRALYRAKTQYDNQKWKVIAETMLDYGCETKWSPHACQLKWQELHPDEGTFEDYELGTWNDKMTTGSTPQRQNSTVSFSREEYDGNRSVGTTPVSNDQGVKQRAGSKGSSRSRSVYEQRQDWTVKPQ